MKETEAEDRRFAEVLGSGLDQLLVFVRFSLFCGLFSVDVVQTGLFGAILTAFLVESRKELREDPVIQAIRNITGTAAHQSPFKPSRLYQAVNGIWFFSLGITLLCAFSGFLARDWLARYNPAIRGKFSNDACDRHLRSLRASDWGLEFLIRLISSSIQDPIYLFAIGLILFLFQDDVGISVSLIVLSVLAALAYITCTLLPASYPGCPFHTHIIYRSLALNRYPRPKVPGIDSTLEDQIAFDKEIELPSRRKPEQSEMEADILAWILTNSTNDIAIEEAVKALAGVESSTYLKDKLFESGASQTLCRRFSENVKVELGSRMNQEQIMRAEAYLYAMLRIVEPVQSETAARFEFIYDSLLQPGQPLRRWDDFPEYLQPLASALRIEMLLVIGKDDPVDYNERTDSDFAKMVESRLLPDIRRVLVIAACEGLRGEQRKIKRVSSQILCKQWLIGECVLSCCGPPTHR